MSIPIGLDPLVAPGLSDALLVVGPLPGSVAPFAGFEKVYTDAQKIDSAVGKECVLVPCAAAPGGRLILSPTGPLNRDYDDVRSYADAALAALKRATKAGATRPCLFVVPPGHAGADYQHFQDVAVLSILAGAHVPLQAREHTGKTSNIAGLSVLPLPASAQEGAAAASIPPAINMTYLLAVEAGRAVARDIGGGDPERMTAANICTYLEQTFKGTCITMRVESDTAVINKEYPLLAAVARCSNQVERHKPRVVHLEYTGEGPITATPFFVGKGITYDTGGADVKAGGHMAGMHRDKCGAAAVAGLFQILALLQPKGVRVVGKLALVRNSIGADSYVADEIIVSRSGCRVRVGNTDAEGRMVLSDLLCVAKEEALTAVNPSLFTMATLTGHVVRAYGEAYSATMDNGPARKAGVSKTLFETGHVWGDPFEISTVRREDFRFIESGFPTEDVVQCNNEPSSATCRGHQFPAAFIAIASGVDKHGLDSDKPIPYTHLDIAGSTHMWPDPVTAAPLPTLAALYVLPNLPK